MRPSYGYGQDLVLELSPQVTQTVLLSLAQSTGALACLQAPIAAFLVPGAASILSVPNPPTVVSLWPSAVHLRKDAASFESFADVTVVTGGTPPPTGPLTLPLAQALGPALASAVPAAQEILAGLGVTIDRLQVQVADTGALALGAGPVSGEELQWFEFSEDFRTTGQHEWDWALALDAQLMIRVILQRAADYATILAGDPDAAVRLDQVVVTEWSPQIEIYISARSTEHDGDAIIRAKLAVSVRNGALVPHFTGSSIELRSALGELAWVTFGDEISQRVHTALAEAFSPVPFLFTLPDGTRLVPRRALIDGGGLRVVGDAVGRIPLPPPRVAALPVTFWPIADGYCIGYPSNFGAQQLRIRNTGSGTLYVCDVWITDGPFYITSWNGPSGWVYNADFAHVADGSGTPIPLYLRDLLVNLFCTADPRQGDAHGTLTILSSNPDQPRLDVALVGRATGTGIARVDPPSFDIRVANTETGRDTVDQGCRDWRPAAVSHPDPPASVGLHNDGDGPLYLCEVNLVDDTDHVFTVDTAIAPRTLVPGDEVPISVWFRPSTVDHRSTATVLLNTSAGPLRIPVSGQIDPAETSKRMKVGISGADLQMAIDLAGERLCAAGNPDVCRIRQLFEPYPADGTVVGVTNVEFHGVEGAIVSLHDDGGAEVVRDEAGAGRRSIIVDGPPPGVEPPGTPCYASYRGLAKEGALRVHVWGRLLTSEGFDAERHGPAHDVAGDGRHIAVATDDGVIVVDGEGHVVAKHGIAAHRLGVGGELLVVASGADLRVLDLARPGATPRASASDAAAVTAVLVAREGVITAAGDRLTWRDPELRPRGDLRLPGTVESLYVVAGRVVAAGAWGAAELVLSDGKLRPVVHHARPHWGARFRQGPTANVAVSITKGRLERWRWHRHRLDRRHLPEAMRLRFPGTRALLKSASDERGAANGLDPGKGPTDSSRPTS